MLHYLVFGLIVLMVYFWFAWQSKFEDPTALIGLFAGLAFVLWFGSLHRNRPPAVRRLVVFIQVTVGLLAIWIPTCYVIDHVREAGKARYVLADTWSLSPDGRYAVQGTPKKQWRHPSGLAGDLVQFFEPPQSESLDTPQGPTDGGWTGGDPFCNENLANFLATRLVVGFLLLSVPIVFSAILVAHFLREVTRNPHIHSLVHELVILVLCMIALGCWLYTDRQIVFLFLSIYWIVFWIGYSLVNALES